MKICKNCGASNFDVKELCEKCGAPLHAPDTTPIDSRLTVIVKILMVAFSVIYLLAAIPFASHWIAGIRGGNWEVAIPAFSVMFAFIVLSTVSACMKSSYSRKLARRKRVGMIFKICTLIFVHPAPGILMLCDRDH